MRFLVLIGALALSGSAFADRLIGIPTARKIPFRSLKIELRAEPRDRGEVEYYLGVGASTSVELEFRSSNFGADRQIGTFDATYNVLSPLTNLVPGMAFGVQDVLDRTPDGMRPFFVVTFRQGFDAIGGEVPADMTLGFSFVKKRIHPLVGASIPFSEEVRLLAEHDGLRISAGIEVKPARPVTLRFLVRGKATLFGLMVQHRF